MPLCARVRNTVTNTFQVKNTVPVKNTILVTNRVTITSTPRNTVKSQDYDLDHGKDYSYDLYFNHYYDKGSSR